MTVTIDRSLFTPALNPADSTSGWTGRSPVSNLSIATSGNIEGTGCIEGRLAVGTGDCTHNAAGVAMDELQFYAWIRPTAPVDTFANAGVTMRISGTSGGATNYGQWVVGGSDLGIVGSGGWINYVIDPLVQFTTINGTPPALAGTAIVDKGAGGTFLGGPGMAQIWIDRIELGTTQIVRGGTGGSPGTWAEAAVADLENGHIKDIAGAIFINSRVRFGDSVGTTSTEFEDSNAVVLFETNMLIGAHVCGFEFEGNSSGTNNCTFGVASGSGVDKVGAAGGTWKASGVRPFRVEAINTDMDATGIFGVSMLGPAVLFDDFVRSFLVDNAGFTDDTRDFNDSGTGDVSPFPSPAVDDAMYIGHDERFYEINIDVGTAKTGTYTLLWEYFNGSTWELLTDLTDDTNGLTTTTLNTVSYAIPDDWAQTAVNSLTRYWIRLRVSAFTSTGTVPLLDSGTVAMAGDVRLEDASCEMISCVLSGMGAVRVRNGAFCKKTTISGTLATAKHAALDLGGADPSADTVRDLTIINNARGVLLKGSGDVTYNFRNFIFGGNTNDVRVDFGGGDTVTINILEGGSTPTIDNVNGSTVVVNQTVNVIFQGMTEGASVKLIADETVGGVTIGDILFEGRADSDGLITYVHPYEGDLDILVRARNQGIAVAAIADDGGVLTDETDEANDVTADDVNLLPATPVADDQYYIAHTEQFPRIKVDVTDANGTGSTITWQYFNGSIFTALSGVVDGTNNFENTGENIVSWTIPGDWATTTINSQGPFFYVRARLTTLGSANQTRARKITIDATRFLPFPGTGDAIRTIPSTGLTETVPWVEDAIAKFDPTD